MLRPPAAPLGRAILRYLPQLFDTNGTNIAKKIYPLPSYMPLMRSLILLSLAMLLISTGALGQTNRASIENLTTSALQSLVVDSSARLESYRFSTEMKQKIDLVNLSSDDAQKLYTHSLGYGLANMTDRALKLSMASLTYSEDDVENSSATALEVYLINDTLYIKVDGNWTAMKIPGLAEAGFQQNTMAQPLEMFNQSRLALIGSENVEGQECYKVRAETDMSMTADRLAGKATALMPVQSMNYSELFHNMSMDVYYSIQQRHSPSQEDGRSGDVYCDTTVFRPTCQRINGDTNKC